MKKTNKSVANDNQTNNGLRCYGQQHLVLFGTIIFFWALFYSFGHYFILLGTILFFWALFYSFGHYYIFLGTILFVWALFNLSPCQR